MCVVRSWTIILFRCFKYKKIITITITIIIVIISYVRPLVAAIPVSSPHRLRTRLRDPHHFPPWSLLATCVYTSIMAPGNEPSSNSDISQKIRCMYFFTQALLLLFENVLWVWFLLNIHNYNDWTKLPCMRNGVPIGNITVIK